MTIWLKEDEELLRANELKLANLVVEEVKLQASVNDMQMRKAFAENLLRKPVHKFVHDHWPFLPHTNVEKNVERLTTWVCENRAALVPLLNKIDEAMK